MWREIVFIGIMILGKISFLPSCFKIILLECSRHSLSHSRLINSISDLDPVGSVSLGRIRILSGNIDPDPGSKIYCDKIKYKSTKIISYNLKKNKILILLYVNIISSKLQQQKTSLWVLNLLQKIFLKKKIGICSILGRIWSRIRIRNRTRIGIRYPGSRSESKWSGSETLVLKIE